MRPSGWARSGSAHAEQTLDRVDREVQDEERPDDPHERVDRREAPAHDLDEDIGDEAGADARGDRVREGHEDDRQEGRDGDLEVVPVDVGDLLHHQEADEDEGRSGRLVRHDRDQRREEGRQEEEDTGDDGRQTGARTLTDTRARLDEHGVR